MSDWKVFRWASLHSPEFRYCHVSLPVVLKCRWFRDYPGWSLTFSIYFQKPGVYVPWSVRDEFCAAHKDDPAVETMFDDIPF